MKPCRQQAVSGGGPANVGPRKNIRGVSILKHIPPPALLNTIDYFLESWFWRPSAIVSYSAGRTSGVRAASHLRDLLAEIGTVSLPRALAYGQVGSVFSEDGTPADEHADRFAKGFARFADELEWYARALRAARAEGLPTG